MDLHQANVPLSSIMRAHVDRSGWLNQLSSNGIRKHWKRRFFVLRANRLFYFKSDKVDEPVAGMLNLDYYASIRQEASFKKACVFRMEPRKTPADAASSCSKGPSFFKASPSATIKPLVAACEDEDELYFWMESIKSKLLSVSSGASVLDSALAKLNFEQYRKKPSSTALRPALKVRNSEESMDSVTYAASINSTGTASSVRSKSPDNEDRDLLYPISKPRIGYRGQLTSGVRKWQELHRRRSSPYLNGGGPPILTAALTTSPLAHSSRLDPPDSGFYDDEPRPRAVTLTRPSFSDLSPLSKSSTLFPEFDDFKVICPEDRVQGETYLKLIRHEMEEERGRVLYH